MLTIIVDVAHYLRHEQPR